ncbi:virulence factor TspB C-terminal domain-related protein [Azotobacter chroococcum]|uniref:virulence factor TspB C-terminal domain-related protein n=1 Tax=Azotobacter chroococcum TaxID=353 RepID=UPI0010ADD4A2|nr:virulence factor TspB C-terminal domain-related protein [Azotobacter chroococcum]TKD46226.1 hypothetical protein FCG41_02380 [Azotobacter chroococcum]
MFALLRSRLCFLGGFDMRGILKAFVLLVGFIAVHAAFAVDYYWHVQGDSAHYSDPSSACDSWGGGIYGSGTVTTATRVSDDEWSCNARPSSGSLGITRAVFRAGDFCPSGSTYNSLTGACDAPEQSPCESTVGQTISHQHRLGDFTGAGQVGGYIPPPGVLCSNSCQYSSTGTAASNVFRFVDNNPNGVFGVYTYIGNGVQCTGGESGVTAPSSTAMTPSTDKSSECSNKVTDAEGRVSYICTAADVFKDPGSVNCGEVSGKFRCYSKTPIPHLTDREVTTEVSEKTNADGSKDITTTTTTTTTNCSGVNSCSTTTSVSNGSDHINSDGSQGSQSSSCEGDCEGPEEEQESSKVSGESCDVSVACEGDAIQCAILRQQKESRCQTEELYDFESNKAAIDGVLQGEQFQITEQEVQAPSFISEATSFLPKSCPSPESASLNTGGLNVSLEFQPLCDFAEALGPLIVIVATVFASLYVGRAFGGE